MTTPSPPPMQIITTGINEYFSAICNSIYARGRVFFSLLVSFSSVFLSFFLFFFLFFYFPFISRTVNSFRIKSRRAVLIGTPREPPFVSLVILIAACFHEPRRAYILSTAPVLTMILNNTRRPSPHLLNVRRIPLVLSVAGNIASLFHRVCLRASDVEPCHLSAEINIFNSSEISSGLSALF